MTTRPLRLIALLMVLALVAAACGGGDGGDDVASDDDATEQVDGDSSGDRRADPGAGSGDDASIADDPGDPNADDSPRDAAGSVGGAGAMAGQSGSEAGAGTGRSGGSASATLEPTAPGRYHVTVDGSRKVGAQSQDMPDRTLEVRPPDGQRQIQVTTADDGSSRTEMEMEFADDGVRLHRISISQQGVAKTFTFSPPVLAAPATAQVGQQWSWSGTSNDGATTVEASFEVLEIGVPVTVGGEQVNTVKVRSITTTSGDLESTATDVQWVSPDHRLIVKTEGSQEGRYGPFTFASQYTWQLDSIRPS